MIKHLNHNGKPFVFRMSRARDDKDLAEKYQQGFEKTVFFSHESQNVHHFTLPDLHQRHAFICCLQINGHIAAGIHICIDAENDRYFNGLYVDEYFRRQGLSVRLLQLTRFHLSGIFSSGEDKAIVRVFESGIINRSASYAFEKAGFTAVGLPERTCITGQDCDQHLVDTSGQDHSYQFQRFSATRLLEASVC